MPNRAIRATLGVVSAALIIIGIALVSPGFNTRPAPNPSDDERTSYTPPRVPPGYTPATPTTPDSTPVPTDPSLRSI